MTPLSPARKAADEFARVVDGAPNGPRDVDMADRYADLLSTVAVLRSQEMPAPRPDFVSNLRERLMDAADTLLVPSESAPPAPVIAFPDAARRRQRRVSVAAAALIVVGGTASVAAAAENSLPGDPLYPLKRGIESAQVTFNSSDSGKGQDLLRQASTRLDEVDGLLDDKADADRITSTLASFKRSATDGADLIFVSYQRNGDPEEINRLRTILGSQLTLLDKLAPAAPGESASAFETARSLLTELDQQARVLCGACGPDGQLSIDSLTSAPALTSLLTLPATQVKNAADADARADLVKKAQDAADDLPEAPATQDPATSGGTGTNPLHPVVPALPSPTRTPVKDTLQGVTNGVGELLTALTEPLTETLDTTLGTVTKGLLNPPSK